MSYQHREHSILGRGRQLPARASLTTRDTDRDRRGAPTSPGAGSARREDLLRAGYTILPNVLLRHYAAVDMTEAELVLVLELWTYWWDERAPFPSVATLAAHMGRTPRQIQQHVERLRRKGLLRVVPRFGANGRQLTNAYDLNPLLARLAAQVEQIEAAVCEMTSRPLDAGAGEVAGEGMHESAPEQDPPQNQEQRSDPMPPTPTTTMPEHVALERVALSSAVYAAISWAGATCGDDLPGASRARAARLLEESGGDEARFLAALEQACAQTDAYRRNLNARLPDGRRRGMPYLFAVLEAALSGQADERSRTRRSTYSARSVEKEPQAAAREPFSDDATWHLVLHQLRQILAPTVYARLLPLQAHTEPDGQLVIMAPSPFEHHWLTRVLYRHLEEALRRVGEGALTVQVTTMAA